MSDKLTPLQIEFCEEFGLVLREYTMVNKEHTLYPKCKTDVIKLAKDGYKVTKVKKFYPYFTQDRLLNSIVILSQITDEPIGLGIEFATWRDIENTVIQNWLDLSDFGAFWEEEEERIKELQELYRV